MYYTIYKVTNKINGKVYIGSHKTKNLNDNYTGSGKYLNYSISKHGIEKFKKEILHVFDTAEEMYAKEAELVDEEFIAESNTYNLKVGGFGGFDYINANHIRPAPLSNKDAIKYGKQGGKKLSKLLKSDKALSKTRSEKIADANRQYKKINGHGKFFGRKHTPETLTKMSLSHKGKHVGKKNSQYGTCWIHNNRVSKKIEKDDINEYLTEGWIKGRKIKLQ